MLFAVIVHAARVTRDRYRYFDRLDRQFAGVEGLGCVVAGDICACCVHNRVRFSKAARVGRTCNVRALGRGVDDRQDIAVCQTFDRVIIGGDRFTRAVDRFGERVAGLLGAVIGDSLILYRNLQGRGSHRQGAEFFLYSIVVRDDLAPVDGVGVRTRTDFRLAAGCGDRNLALIRCDQTGDRRFRIRQRRAVVCLGVAVGSNRQFSRLDLQTAGTDEQVHAVVRVIRQICKREAEIVLIIACIRICDRNIAQTGCAAVALYSAVIRSGNRRAVYRIPNVIQVLRLIPGMADLHVVRDTLVAVGEAGLLDGTVIDVAGPAVGLDTNCDVDLGDLERAADVANRVVVLVRAFAGNNSTLRCDRRNARIQTTVIGRVIRVRIVECNSGQRIAFEQTFDLDLTGDFRGQRQRRAVVLLRIAIRRNGDLLLIEQREDKPIFVCSSRFRNLIGRTCRRSVV